MEKLARLRLLDHGLAYAPTFGLEPAFGIRGRKRATWHPRFPIFWRVEL
jgi:hypothetical protein